MVLYGFFPLLIIKMLRCIFLVATRLMQELFNAKIAKKAKKSREIAEELILHKLLIKIKHKDTKMKFLVL